MLAFARSDEMLDADIKANGREDARLLLRYIEKYADLKIPLPGFPCDRQGAYLGVLGDRPCAVRPEAFLHAGYEGGLP